MTFSRARLCSPSGALYSSTQWLRSRAAPDATAQLVQLCETEPFRILDHHQRCVRHVDADFDHGRRDEQIDLARLEPLHDVGFLAPGETSMQQRNSQGR